MFTAISVAETGASRPQSYGKIDYFNVYDLNQTKTVSQKNTEITTKPEQFLQKSIRQIFNEHLSVFFFLSQSLGRMLDARQLGLKLIANVTFGYTSAHFSGRMPCVEVSKQGYVEVD